MILLERAAIEGGDFNTGGKRSYASAEDVFFSVLTLVVIAVILVSIVKHRAPCRNKMPLILSNNVIPELNMVLQFHRDSKPH